MKNTKIKKMVILGLMLAIEIVLSRFLSIQTATMKLAFNFIPVALVALMVWSYICRLRCGTWRFYWRNAVSDRTIFSRLYTVGLP